MMRQVDLAEDSVKAARLEGDTRIKDTLAVAHIDKGGMHIGGGAVQASGGRKFGITRASKRAWLASVAATLFFLAGCTTTTIARLDDKFDTDALGSPPSQFPPPSPPDDQITSTAQQPITSTVVADPAGGRWLRITPQPAFVADPDIRRFALNAWSEGFTTSPPANIRGSLRLRFDGLGIVTVALRLRQGSNYSGYIGGFELANGISHGQAYVLHEFPAARIGDIYPLPANGIFAEYQPGTEIKINWSIDQPSRTFAVSALGGPSQSTTFAAESSGVATTPIQQLSLWVFLQKPSSNMVVFFDNLYAEEYR